MLHDPTFWVGISFIGFIGVLVYFKVPGMVTAALDKRAELISNELDEARRLREEAQALLAEYERKHRNAEKEAAEIIALAREEAGALTAETKAQLAETLERRMKVSEQKIAQAEIQAIGEVRAAAAELAVQAAEKLLQKKLTAATANKLIEQSIKDVKTKLN